MSACPICESDDYSTRTGECPECGLYSESRAHGWERREWEQAVRRIEERHR